MFTRSAELYDAVYGFKDYVAEAGNLHALIQARARGRRRFSTSPVGREGTSSFSATAIASRVSISIRRSSKWHAGAFRTCRSTRAT